jgi:hypothetical protein
MSGFSHLFSFGYIDGSTGSMLLQAAMAGIVSASFLFKTQWHKLTLLFSRKSVQK